MKCLIKKQDCTYRNSANICMANQFVERQTTGRQEPEKLPKVPDKTKNLCTVARAEDLRKNV